MCNILEPRGYRLKCRGKINVKGKGSMVTYFLRRKQFPSADDEDALTHQSSRITQPSEDYDLCDLEDQQNMDLARLTEKRKSLCRQHHIFSSLTNKSVASEQSMADSIEFSDDTAIPSERVRLLHKSASKSSATAISPEIGGKMAAKATIPAHCAPLKDSIESLEKMLKNDYSLSDINATKLHALPVGLQKLSTESGETLVSNGSIDAGAGNFAGDAVGQERRPEIDRILEHDDSDDDADDDLQLQLAPKDETLLKTLANKFRFRNDGIMKVSRSLYPFYRDQAHEPATATMTNSKSLHYFPTTHQQNGSSVFL